MTEDRFLALVASYGADVARWPTERAEAQAFVAARPDLAGAAMAAERGLDGAMSRYIDPDPSPDLRQRIVAMAPRERRRGRLGRWAMGAGLGLGLAASCVAGVAAGFTLAPATVQRLIVGPVEAAPGDLGSLADPTVDAADS